MKTGEFKRTREPQEFREDNGSNEMVKKPHTDLWQRTYYHFQNDNAPVYEKKDSKS